MKCPPLPVKSGRQAVLEIIERRACFGPPAVAAAALAALAGSTLVESDLWRLAAILTTPSLAKAPAAE